MAENTLVQTIRDAEIDARSLSEFIYYPDDAMISRRLAPPIHTLNYYLNLFDTVATDAAERIDTFLSGVERTLGLSAADIYKDVAAGLAATEDTDKFWVVPNAGDDLENLTLYSNNDSEAIKLYELYNLESYLIEEGSNWEEVNYGN